MKRLKDTIMLNKLYKFKSYGDEYLSYVKMLPKQDIVAAWEATQSGKEQLIRLKKFIARVDKSINIFEQAEKSSDLEEKHFEELFEIYKYIDSCLDDIREGCEMLKDLIVTGDYNELEN